MCSAILGVRIPACVRHRDIWTVLFARIICPPLGFSIIDLSRTEEGGRFRLSASRQLLAEGCRVTFHFILSMHLIVKFIVDGFCVRWDLEQTKSL